MLFLIGLGLDNELNKKTLSKIKKCSRVFLEKYTSWVDKREVEKKIGRKTEEVDRDFVENGKILDVAEKEDIVLLVSGDVFSATTHYQLIMDTRKRKIKTEVLHNISIINAVSDTGLQAYKFGKTASLPKFTKSYKPRSFFDIYKENKSINAHTLLLIDPELSVKEAVEEMLESGFSAEEKIVLCNKLGRKEQKIIFSELGKLKKLAEKKKFDAPFCIILPSELHFAEKEALKQFKT